MEPPTPQQTLTRLGLAFPRQPITAGTYALYLEELADVPAEVLAGAVRDLIRTEEFFPTVRAIRAACAELALGLPSEADALAQVEARIDWARLDEGERGDPPAAHDLVRAAAGHVGGFHAFRSADNPEVVRGQFLKLFRGMRASAIRDVQTGQKVLGP